MKHNFLVFLLVALCLVPGIAMAAEINVAGNVWESFAGNWVQTAASITNTDTSNSNTNAYTKVAQNGSEIIFEWTVNFQSTVFNMGPAAGMHIMCSEGASAVRGSSYLVFQDQTFIRLYKTENGRLVKVGDLSTPTLNAGETHSYKVVYSPKTGLMSVYRDGAAMGTYTDPDPIQSGEFISLRTNGTAAEFTNIKVSTK